MKSGWGSTLFKDGSKHLGEYSNDKADGFGVLRKVYSKTAQKTTWGDLYTGEFKDGQPEGYGVGITAGKGMNFDGVNTFVAHAKVFDTLKDSEVIYQTLNIKEDRGLDKQTFHSELAVYGSKLKKEETDAVFDFADKDKDGKISLVEFNSYIFAVNLDNMEQVMDISLSWLDIANFAPSINGQWLAGGNIRDPAINSGSMSGD